MRCAGSCYQSMCEVYHKMNARCSNTVNHSADDAKTPVAKAYNCLFEPFRDNNTAIGKTTRYHQ
jgi:hypothetical protein